MSSNGACIAHFTESKDGSLYKVVGVGRTLGLCKYVLDAEAFEDGAHGTTGNHSGTFGGREDKHFGTAETGGLLMGNGTLDDGHLDEVFLGSFYTLGDSSLNFSGLAKSVTDDALTITDHNDGCESEGATTLGYLGHTIDSNESVLEIVCIYIYSVCCHNHLEFKTTIAGAFGTFLDAAMVKITITIENYSSDAGCEGSLCCGFSNLESLFLLGTSLEAERRSAGERGSSLVIDELDIDLLVAAENAHAGTLGGSGDLIANAILDFYASCFFCFCHNREL